MVEIFRDPLWQFIGAVLTLVTIAISVYIFNKERTKKGITYQINSFYPLLSLSEKEKGDFRVLYKGREIQDLFLISLQISNTGNSPVVSKDFEKPISFTFGKTSRIFSAEIINTQPKNLSADLSIKNNKVILSPLLLNNGDAIEIKCLVTSPEADKLIVEGRIAGVKEITEKRIDVFRYLGWSMIGSITAILATVGMFLAKPSVNWEKLQPAWPFLIIVIIGLIIGVLGLIGYGLKKGFRSSLELIWRAISSALRTHNK